jgi:peptide/nickel transport system ATP-binding protein
MLMPPASSANSMDAGARASDVVLAVRDLKTQFFTRDGVVRAVDGISFDLHRGETLCIVGESGCGKSVTALSILGLIPQTAGRIVGGSITFEGTELTTLSAQDMRRIRGNRISMIFQEPMTSLNPVLTVGAQIAESLQIHQKLGRRAAWNRANEMLSLVRIAEPKQRAHEYPHQLSGGMRQRVMIAMALACNPQVLIADEPTTALDVTIQAQILNLMLELKDRLGTAIILITHDLGVVAEIAQRVIVMYAGRVAEEASVDELLRNPKHPYTCGLIGSIPRRRAAGERRLIRSRLQEIAGIVPSLREDIPGCAFAPRCDFANERCKSKQPALDEIALNHYAACWELERAEQRLEGVSVREQI